MKQKVIDSIQYKRFPFTPSSFYDTGNFSITLDSAGWTVPNVPVNNTVLPVVDTLRERWNQDTPACLFDNLGHGGLGHVLFFKQEKEASKPIWDEEERTLINFDPTHSLIARVSYGSSYGKDNPDWDFTSLERVHLSVLATKVFRPEDNITPLIRENLYFTVRWDGKNSEGKDMPFENATELLGQKGHYTFDPLRMSYYQAHAVDVAHICKNMGVEKYSSFYPVAKREFTPQSVSLDEFSEANPDSPFEYYVEKGIQGIDVVPQVGYNPLLNALSKYGNVGVEDMNFLISSTPEQGIEYFIKKVIPSVENYAFSKRI
ncbi:MAG: hypothetical protein ACQESE_02220 [Nanobdellota archaeon]